MSTAALPRPASAPPLTPDDLLRMAEAGKGYELIDGRLEEKEMSARSSRIGVRVVYKLETHCETVSPIWVFGPDGGFQCFAAHPGRVRKPDAAVIAFDRMTREQYEEDGFIEIVPDLVVEVVSPNDLAREVNQKRGEWLAAGVSEVWEVYPDTSTVDIYRAGGSTTLHDGDELASPTLLPGFTVPVADLFRVPGPPPQAPAAGGE